VKSDPDATIIAAIEAVVVGLADAQVHALCSAIRSHTAFSSVAAAAALGAVASPNYRECVNQLVDVWTQNPSIPGSALALSLTAALTARLAAQAEEVVELVWTGPTSPSVPVRLTREILLDLISSSRRRLTIVSFAAYRVDDVIGQLTTAARRGVDIRLVLEAAEESHGRLSHDAADTFDHLKGHARFFVWPRELRAWSGSGIGALHAKAAIADASAAFVTSANLTGYALTSNMELGILVRGGEVPLRLEAHFDELIAHGILRPLT
jgi:phosphatidylserine/phosphatidylglycerophosphate/cardiolipin synthase-like enzyme